MAYQTGGYPGFSSMKRLGVFVLPPGWDVSPLNNYFNMKRFKSNYLLVLQYWASLLNQVDTDPDAMSSCGPHPPQMLVSWLIKHVHNSRLPSFAKKKNLATSKAPDLLPIKKCASLLRLANQILFCARSPLSGGKVLEKGRVTKWREKLSSVLCWRRHIMSILSCVIDLLLIA